MLENRQRFGQRDRLGLAIELDRAGILGIAVAAIGHDANVGKAPSCSIWAMSARLPRGLNCSR